MSLKAKTTLVVITSLYLQACSTSNSFNQTSDVERIQVNELATTELSQGETPAAQFIMRGQLVIGPDTHSFTPCDSKQQFWAEFNRPQQNAVLALSTKPYQPMYAELIGTLAPTKNSSYSGGFAAQINVSTINLITTENPQRCNLPLRSTRAVGNEPFWSVSFNKNHVNYTKMDSEKPLGIMGSDITSQKRVYNLSDHQLELSRELCRDSMSDAIYGWKASLTSEDKQLNGCAALSNFDSTLNWSGTYQAISNDPNALTVTLELNPDHTALTRYQYDDNQQERWETGYWQQINSSQVQVTMTHHQGQKLISERIFSKKDNAIRATLEKVNGIIYTIHNNGLVLFKSEN